MSYKGYDQVLCANGHLHQFDCYDTPQLRLGAGEYQWDDHDYSEDEVYHCPDCGALAVWREAVDQTNNVGVSTFLKEYKSAELSICEHCGLTKQISPAQYYVPSNQGHRINEEVALEVPTVECGQNIIEEYN